MIGIYMYENKQNHKKYIGQSTNIERRKREHLKWPSKYSSFDTELQAIGEDQFIFSILEECKVQQLDERETYWIKFYDSVNTGYNLTYGGQSYRGEANPGAKLSDDDVRAIIDKLRDTNESIQNLAKEYNVHYNTISNINRCVTWTHLHNYRDNIHLTYQGSLHRGGINSNTVITTEIAKNIIELIINSNQSLASIARQFGIKDSMVYDINRCGSWKYLHHYQYNIREESKLEKIKNKIILQYSKERRRWCHNEERTDSKISWKSS